MEIALTAQDVRGVINDLIGSTLGLPVTETDSLKESTPIDGEGLGADSMELMELATQVSRFFRLHETGLEDKSFRQ